MDSCGKTSCADLRNPLSWHVYSKFWLHSMLYKTIGRLQHHQLDNCHSCQISHYSMSSQRCLHIYVIKLHCMGNGGTTHYLLKQPWQTMYLKKSEKWKITFLSLNKAVLSNIYKTKRKQGQRCTFIDIVNQEGCHRIWVRKNTKKNQVLCLEEMLITNLLQGLFRIWCVLWRFLCLSVCETYNPYLFQENCNKSFALHYLLLLKKHLKAL